MHKEKNPIIVLEMPFVANHISTVTKNNVVIPDDKPINIYGMYLNNLCIVLSLVYAIIVKMKNKLKKKNAWLKRQESDIYVKQAREMGYRSRAAFKLLEIDQKYKILQKANIVVDIGSAPGGWSQVISNKFANTDRREQIAIQKSRGNIDNLSNMNKGVDNFIKKERKIIAIDLLEMDTLPYVEFYQEDFTSEELQAKISGIKPDLILSDMAPNTVGHPATDHLRSMYLSNLVVDFVQKTLKYGGNFAIKIFEGAKEQNLIKRIREIFQKTEIFKPKSSRSESKEIYIIGLSKK